MHGDCLELMKSIPDNSIDMVLTDPPYGTTACKWDTVIPFEPMWEQLKRITKDNGAILLFGTEPFSSHLRLSNPKMYRHDIYWKKDQFSNVFFIKKQFGKVVENCSLFFKRQPTYNPQMWFKGTPSNGGTSKKVNKRELYGKQDIYTGDSEQNGSLYRYPVNVLEYSKVKRGQHPTQKPVALLEYLIKTYTLENETVLDFTMGSGSTGVAAKKLNRSFIGIEQDNKYFEIAKERIYGNHKRD